MRIFYLTTALALGLMTVSGPALASLSGPVTSQATVDEASTDGQYQLAKRRGGRDRDDSHSGKSDRGDRHNSRGRDDDGDRSGSGRRRPRVPGGSGCDDPGDVAEHPECASGAVIGVGSGSVVNFFDNLISGSNRRRPRVPGGSGCDDPGDILEHPECTP